MNEGFFFFLLNSVIPVDYEDKLMQGNCFVLMMNEHKSNTRAHKSVFGVYVCGSRGQILLLQQMSLLFTSTVLNLIFKCEPFYSLAIYIRKVNDATFNTTLRFLPCFHFFSCHAACEQNILQIQ